MGDLTTTIRHETGMVKNELTGQTEIEVFHHLFVRTCTDTRTRRFHYKRAYSNIENLSESRYANKFNVFTCNPPFSSHRIVVKLKKVAADARDTDDHFRRLFFECYFNDKLCKGQHPNIVRVLNMWAVERFHEIYIEFEHGGQNLELFARERRHDIEPVLAKRLIKHALSALAYCHGQRVIHCDVSEKNFVINDKQVLKLCDFDMAREVNANGVIDYDYNTNDARRQSPELIMQLPTMGYGVDIHAMACVIIMLIGRDDTLFESRDFIAQLLFMQSFTGPIPKDMADLSRNKDIDWAAMGRVQIKNVAAVFTGLPSDPMLFDLLGRMFDVNQYIRISAAMALQHPFFYA